MKEEEMKEVSDWLAANSLSPNCYKSKFMLFDKPPRKIHIPNIRLNNNYIDHVNKFNFLGPIMGNTLENTNLQQNYPVPGNKKLFKNYVTQ